MTPSKPGIARKIFEHVGLDKFDSTVKLGMDRNLNKVGMILNWH